MTTPTQAAAVLTDEEIDTLAQQDGITAHKAPSWFVDNIRAAEAAAPQAADAAEWEKLRDPALLHAALLRGLPAKLTREQFLHLAGGDPEPQQAQAVAGGGIERVIDAFEAKERGVAQAHIAAQLVAELRAALARPASTQQVPMDEALMQATIVALWDGVMAINNLGGAKQAMPLHRAITALRQRLKIGGAG